MAKPLAAASTAGNEVCVRVHLLPSAIALYIATRTFFKLSTTMLLAVNHTISANV